MKALVLKANILNYVVIDFLYNLIYHLRFISPFFLLEKISMRYHWRKWQRRASYFTNMYKERTYHNELEGYRSRSMTGGVTIYLLQLTLFPLFPIPLILSKLTDTLLIQNISFEVSCIFWSLLFIIFICYSYLYKNRVERYICVFETRYRWKKRYKSKIRKWRIWVLVFYLFYYICLFLFLF